MKKYVYTMLKSIAFKCKEIIKLYANQQCGMIF